MRPSKITNLIAEWICQTALAVSAVTVTAFTVERYLAICHPFFVQSSPKKSRVKKIVISIWSISALLALIPVAQTFIVRHVEKEDILKLNDNVLQYLRDVWAILYFFMPMSAITVMYVLIWLRLKKSSNSQQINDRADRRTLMMFGKLYGTVYGS